MRTGLAKAKKELSATEYTLAVQYIYGTLRTGELLYKWGYDLYPVCQYCGQRDTQYHRTGSCSHGDANAKQNLRQALSEMEALMEHPPHQLWIPAPRVPQGAPDWDPQARDAAGTLIENPPSIEPNDHAIYLDVKRYRAAQRQGSRQTQHQGSSET